MKDIAQEAHEEARESAVPGARGKEYRDKERMGDVGQAYRKGGGIHGGNPHHGHAPKHHSVHKRERGGYMPEEVEASEHERGQGKRGLRSGEAAGEPKGEHDGEAHEEYPNDGERKRGGGVKKKHGHKRAKGGVLPLDGAKEHKTHSLAKFHHHGRKHGGSVKGEAEKHRPDRRARGGHVTADLRPETAAGNMSLPSYLHQHDAPMSKGHGLDSTGPRALEGGKRPGPSRD